MIGAVLRLFTKLVTPREFHRPAGAVWRPSPARVGVIDATEYGIGDSLARLLGAAHIQARAASPLEIMRNFEAMVLLVPVDPVRLGDSGMALLSAVDDVCADDGLRMEFACSIVIVWVVEASDRARSATLDPGVNYANLLIGSSWRAQLARTGSDTEQAVRSRSRAVASMAGAETPTGSASNPETVERILSLDADLIHALLCRHPQSREPGGMIEWESVVAAVDVRLRGGRRTG